MSRLEERLRDAYRDEAGAVTPESILGLGEAIAAQSARTPRSARSGRAPRWSRWLTPLAAAAAVALIVVVAAVAIPHGTGQPQATPGAPPTYLIDDSTGVSPLPVRNATTGALVARVTVPPGYPGGDSRTYITGVATSNGRDYLVAEYANPCRSWIYQFRLDSTGQPSALTPFTALPTARSELYGLTISGNGQMVGFTTTACMGAKAQPNYVGVTNLSLQGEGPPSLVRVIPTSAAPGSAAGLGRTVAGPQAGHWISFSAISADGSKVYFSDVPESTLINGQIRVTDLATGRSRVVYAPAGEPGLITSDPGVRHLLLQVGEKAPQPGQLVRLDLATGKTTDLPARRFVLPAILYW